MADNNSSIIKPVDELFSIAGLTPAKHHQQRKQKQQLQDEKEQQEEQQNKKVVEQDLNAGLSKNEDDQKMIDYRA